MGNRGKFEVKGGKLKYSPEKNNVYGTNHFFQVLGETVLNEIVDLGKENMKLQIWEYKGKFYLKFNGKKVHGYSIDLMNGSNGTEIAQLIFKKVFHTLWI